MNSTSASEGTTITTISCLINLLELKMYQLILTYLRERRHLHKRILALYTFLQITAYNNGQGNPEGPCISYIPCSSITSLNNDVIDLVPKILIRSGMMTRTFNTEHEENTMIICSFPDCFSNPCHNGATCVETMIGYLCDLPDDSSVCYSDCQAAYDAGHHEDGIYQICFVTSGGIHKGPYSVWCTYYKDGFDWMVIQRRYDGSVNFQRPWDDFKHGFGNLSTEFWLGNELIHDLTNLRRHRLRIEMVREDGLTMFSKYRCFRVGDESSGYQLHVSRNDGSNTGDAFGLHDGSKFSTIDRDNDQLAGNESSCAREKGAGWYADCGAVSFNMRRTENGTLGEWWTNGTAILLGRVTLKMTPVRNGQ